MEVLVLILVGIVTIGGLYRIVWDEIRQSRQADKVAQESSAAVLEETMGEDRAQDSGNRG